MTTAEVIQLLQDKGATLRAERDQLVVNAPVGTLTDEIIQRLHESKAAAIDWLHGGLPVCVSIWPPYWRERYEERAAIMQFDGGLDFGEAERRAEEMVRAVYRRAR